MTDAPTVAVKRTMLEVGVEGDLFRPHAEDTVCATAGCVERPEGWKSWDGEAVAVIDSRPFASPVDGQCPACNRPVRYGQRTILRPFPAGFQAIHEDCA